MASELTATNLRKSFKKRFAVDDVSLSLGEGESVGLLGPNGAGKSTTIAILSTLMPPDSGDVQFNGHSALADPSALRRALGCGATRDSALPETDGG